VCNSAHFCSSVVGRTHRPAMNLTKVDLGQERAGVGTSSDGRSFWQWW
jgi:hypothetical protein